MRSETPPKRKRKKKTSFLWKRESHFSLFVNPRDRRTLGVWGNLGTKKKRKKKKKKWLPIRTSATSTDLLNQPEKRKRKRNIFITQS